MNSVNGSTNVSTSLFGTFRDIREEAQGTSVGRALVNGSGYVKVPQALADADPLVSVKIKNRALLFSERRLLRAEDVSSADRVAAKFGYTDLHAFAERLALDFSERLKEAGLKPRRHVNFAFVATAILGSDAMRTVLSDEGTNAFGLQADDLLQTALAVCALVSEGRLALEDVPVYVGRKVCDARSTDDVAGMTQALLNRVKDRSLDGEMQGQLARFSAILEQELSRLPADGAHAEKRQALRDAVEGLRRCREDCRKARAQLVPDDVFLRSKEDVGSAEYRDSRGYLEAQYASLRGFLEKKPKPDFAQIAAADQDIAGKAYDIFIRGLAACGSEFQLAHLEEINAITDDLDAYARRSMQQIASDLSRDYDRGVLNVLKVSCRQMEFSVRAQAESLIRQEQERALRQIGYRPGATPPRAGVYAMSLSARVGLMLGGKKANVRVGGSYGYNVIVKIEASGKVRLLGLTRKGIDVRVAAENFLGCTAVAQCAGGIALGTTAIYDSVAEMLDDSPDSVADALMRINGGLGGLFHRKGRTDELARKVDNYSYVNALKRYGLFDDVDSFSTRPLNPLVVSTEKVRQEDRKGSVKLKGTGPVAKRVVSDAQFEIKETQVETKRTDRTHILDVAYDLDSLFRENPEFARQGKALETGAKLAVKAVGQGILSVDPRQLVLDRLHALEKELDDFLCAVRYTNWKNDGKRYGRGVTAFFSSPKMSEADHLWHRGIRPGRGDWDRVNGARAEYLRSLADDIRRNIALAGIAQANAAEDGDAEKLGLFKDRVGVLVANFRKCLSSLEFDIRTDSSVKSVSDKAKPNVFADQLYVSETHDAKKQRQVHASMFYHVGENLGGAIPKGDGPVNTFKNIAPGFHLGLDYVEPDAKNQTGVPLEDSRTLDLSIGGSSFPGNATLTAMLQEFLLKANLKELDGVGGLVKSLALDSMTVVNSHGHLLGGLLGMDLSGSGKDGERRILNTSLGMTSDSGLTLRFRLQTDANGKWRLGSIDLLARSDIRASAELTVGKVVSLYVGGDFRMSSETTLTHTLKANSLVPFLSEYGAFDVAVRGIGDPDWVLFLRQNDEALKSLALSLAKGNGLPDEDNPVLADFVAYLQQARFVDEEEETDFLDRLLRCRQAICEAKTVDERLTAFSVFGSLVGELTARYKGLSPEIRERRDPANEEPVVLKSLEVGPHLRIYDEMEGGLMSLDLPQDVRAAEPRLMEEILL